MHREGRQHIERRGLNIYLPTLHLGMGWGYTSYGVMGVEGKDRSGAITSKTTLKYS
jgi:hypothetical protein